MSESSALPPKSVLGVPVEALELEIKELYETGKVKITPLPQVLRAIRQEIDREDARVDRLGHLIEQDPVLSGRLLKLANSASYQSLAAVKRVDMALSRVGLQVFRSMLYATFAYSFHSGVSKEHASRMKALWAHGSAVAVACRQIGIHSGMPDIEELFLVGLFHDIGRVLILQALPFLSKPLPDMILDHVIDQVHEWVPPTLVEEWELPESVHRITRHHHNISPEELRDPVLAVLLLAESLAAPICPTPWTEEPTIGRDVISGVLNLKEIALVDVEVELEAQVGEFQQMMESSG